MVYQGGFIGPFAAQSLVAVVPDVAETFGKIVQEASFAITAYMVPFASVMLFSTSLVRSLPPHRVVQVAYAATVVGAVTCLVAANWWVLIAGVVIMAVANAFTLPVLQVLLRELAPPDRLGIALGRYSAAQSLGNCAAPLVGGLLAALNWQLVNVVTLTLAAAMVVIGVPQVPAGGAEADNDRPDWRLLVLHMVSIFVVGFCVIGMATVLTIHLDSVFAMPASQRGFVIMAGGLAAFALASRVGASVDKRGAPVVLTACAAAAAVAIAGMPFVPAFAVAILWAVAFVAAQGMQTTVTYLVLRAPGGARFNSTVLACRFFGLALTPIAILPLYLRSSVAGFALPAAILAAVAVLYGAKRR